jgi:hypothetical protein
MFGDGSPDALGCSGDDGHLASEFFADVVAHSFVLSIFWFVFTIYAAYLLLIQ